MEDKIKRHTMDAWRMVFSHLSYRPVVSEVGELSPNHLPYSFLCLVDDDNDDEKEEENCDDRDDYNV